MLIPEVRNMLGASTGEVTAAITVYMLPFAALQIVSGTIGERLGRERTLRWPSPSTRPPPSARRR